ncbi:LysR family transcriptional regulator [Nitratireductor indicus]|uniref:LysR family transcriptional regulator n=1 Tax=Nitratireductor indicus C115 TaxID=1231190 RepID=K2N344_9HYPH|nr:LysR family transcriptional regulator [Nitratireductor indicus]EKF41843.1 LysR family transcriptional regulator [Nitratireductor indicus C115]MDS1136876.1 LysR family transcriptional regulator [Nitratireductor indicus]SFQ66738.1 DNA-binding transcriptional regulator, LysR family [Nitratireductor indicus]
MNLRSMDLNLLLVFDAVYSERSISRAALRLNLSQPAVSNALARLRHTVDDPLFKREGSGMVPTPRAKSLRDPIRQALELLERGFRGDEEFDYSKSNREFVIAVEDYGETVLIPRFIDWLAEAAPGIHIQIRPEPSSLLTRELREGTVDLALDYFALQGEGFVSKCVLTEGLVTLSRIDHPKLGEQLTLDSYLDLQHVVITPRRKSRPMIDLALNKRGLKRDIALTVPHFLSMPAVVQRSNLLATLPRRMAFIYADHFRLKTYTVPVRTPEFPVFLIWHDTHDADPAHRWLRNHLIALCENL